MEPWMLGASAIAFVLVNLGWMIVFHGHGVEQKMHREFQNYLRARLAEEAVDRRRLVSDMLREQEMVRTFLKTQDGMEYLDGRERYSTEPSLAAAPQAHPGDPEDDMVGRIIEEHEFFEVHPELRPPGMSPPTATHTATHMSTDMNTESDTGMEAGDVRV